MNLYKDEIVEFCIYYSSDFIKESYIFFEILIVNVEVLIFFLVVVKLVDWVEFECFLSVSFVFSMVFFVVLRIMKLGLLFFCVIVDEVV